MAANPILRVARYPFTGGGIVFGASALIGALPYAGSAGVLVARSFALPVVRTSAGRSAGSDSMPALLPLPPGLGGALAAGAALHLWSSSPRSCR